ncbi:MAG: spermidine synthase [Bacteroidetes bacterium]|nr:MAG: spermidine synthase [Bacteroidota bacterium]
MSALGRHILVEFLGCTPEIMNDVMVIEEGMNAAAARAGATIINSTFHHFSPYGVSGVVVIQESHLAIHTWPEYQYAAVDLFTCGDGVDPWISFDHLKQVFGAKNYSALEMKRGSLNLLKRVDFDLKVMREEAREHLKKETHKRNVWLTDKDENQAFSLRHTGENLYDKRSDFQHTRVINSYAYGKALIIDNMVMTTERDEFHYHEMIAHPAMLSHGAIKKALVIGGGDGGTVREVLRHPNVEKVVMIEIDPNVVEASRLHFPAISSAFNDPRLELHIMDGIHYVHEAKENTFDAIFVDSTDPVGPGEGLFNKTFYEHCKRILNEKGILVVQGESPQFHRETFVEINHLFKAIFGREQVHTMLFNAPTYPTGIWAFQIATQRPMDLLNTDPAQIDTFAQQHHLRYYNSAIHRAAFALPTYVKQLLHE